MSEFYKLEHNELFASSTIIRWHDANLYISIIVSEVSKCELSHLRLKNGTFILVIPEV